MLEAFFRGFGYFGILEVGLCVLRVARSSDVLFELPWTIGKVAALLGSHSGALASFFGDAGEVQVSRVHEEVVGFFWEEIT